MLFGIVQETSAYKDISITLHKTPLIAEEFFYKFLQKIFSRH